MKKTNTVKITTDEILESIIIHYSNILRITAQDGDVFSLKDICNDYCDALQLMACEDNMPGIRKLFKAGNSMMMLGKYFDHVSNANSDETEFEIRVYKNDILLGVVIDSEICY